ncbi:MAG TPA: hypothetical protein VIL72_14250, partial [Beijerinckiaceae bacterium]
TRSPRAQRIVEHMVAAVEACVVENEPFQNFYFTRAFPDDVYAEMRARMPERARYLPLNIKRWKNAAGESTRDRLCLSEGEIERIAPQDQALWTDVTDALMAPELGRAVYRAMRRDVALRLGCSEEEAATQRLPYPSALLVRDFEEYKLKPHPDGQPRVVTMMFYLADEGAPTDLGTSLYREKPLLKRLLGDRFEEVKRFPFLPNSVGAFAVNDRPERTSWHGRELIEGAAVARDSIILSFLSEERPDFGKKHNY